VLQTDEPVFAKTSGIKGPQLLPPVPPPRV
jgi:hypothetical protein